METIQNAGDDVSLELTILLRQVSCDVHVTGQQSSTLLHTACSMMTSCVSHQVACPISIMVTLKNKELVSKELVSKELVSKELVSKELIPKELVTKELLLWEGVSVQIGASIRTPPYCFLSLPTLVYRVASTMQLL